MFLWNILSALNLLLFISWFTISSADDPTVICLGAAGRCNGEVTCDTGKLFNHSAPITSFHNLTLKECVLKCIDKPGCLHVVYSNSLHNCSLHRDGVSFTMAVSDMVCTWRCCNIVHSCRKSMGKCRGYWVKYGRRSISGVSTLFSFQTSHTMNCLSECHKHPLCGHANFKDAGKHSSDGACQLLKFDSYSTVHLTKNTSLTAYKWHCCPHDDTDIDRKCRPGTNKCRGRMTPLYVTPQKQNNTGLVGYFHTRDKLECLRACERNPYCTKALYNQTFDYCLMKSKKWGSREPCLFNVELESHTWWGYQWKCCDKEDEIEIDDESDLPECECFDGSVQVALNECGHPSTEHQKIMKANLTAFWVRHELSTNGWRSFHNGYMKIWAKGKSSRCPKKRCQLFSTFVEPVCPQIVNRSEWFARPNRSPFIKFPHTPVYVGIKDTGCPIFGCYTSTSCSSIVRLYQRYHQAYLNYNDITYNFLIGSDGKVYEGRGSEYICGDPESFRAVTINIAFIGKYETLAPSIASVKAAKQLIWCLHKKGLITKNYLLYPYSALTSDPDNPGKMLADLLNNWPHHPGGDLKDIPCPERLPLWYILVVYALGPTVALLLFGTGITVGYAYIWSHTDWCPKRAKLNPQTTIRICELDDQNILIKSPGNLPPSCVLRDRFSWKVSPTPTPILMLKTNTTCSCIHHLHLLWIKCSLYTLDDFLKRAALSLSTFQCKAFTLLGMGGNRPFIVHGGDMVCLLTLIDNVITGKCVCRASSNVQGRCGAVPRTDTDSKIMAPGGWSPTWLGWMGEDVGDAEPIDLQRVFVMDQGRRLEVTYTLYRGMPQVLGNEAEITPVTDAVQINDPVYREVEIRIDGYDRQSLIDEQA